MDSKYITVKDLRSILDEKLAPIKSEVSELRGQLEETNKFLDLANAKYEEAMNTLSKHNEVQKEITAENKILKSAMQSLEGKVYRMQAELNDIEQYSRRECLEIQGIPLPKDGGHAEDTNQIITKIGELMSVEIDEVDISVSHRLPVSRNYKGNRSEPAIIAKFVRRDVKEQFYRARKELKNLTTKDLGYDISNNIYINESLTESNKALFKECVKAKKEMGFTFIWTSNGKIFLRKDEHSPVIHIKSKDDIVKKLLSR